MIARRCSLIKALSTRAKFRASSTSRRGGRIDPPVPPREAWHRDAHRNQRSLAAADPLISRALRRDRRGPELGSGASSCRRCFLNSGNESRENRDTPSEPPKGIEPLTYSLHLHGSDAPDRGAALMASSRNVWPDLDFSEAAPCSIRPKSSDASARFARPRGNKCPISVQR